MKLPKYAKKSEIKYMMRRALSLLLSDLRSLVRSEDSVGFSIEPQRDLDEIEPPSFHVILLLQNAFISAKALEGSIIPRIRVPGQWDYYLDYVEESSVNAPIVWGETFSRWSAGSKDFVVRKKKRIDDAESLRFIVFSILEFCTHISILNEEMKKILPKDRQSIGFFGKSISYLENVEKRLRRFLKENFRQVAASISDEITVVAESFRVFLNAPETASNIMQEYSKSIEPNEPNGTYLESFVEDLMDWRRQFLKCRVWLGDRSGFNFNRRGTVPYLFEIWCFFEIILELCKKGEEEIIQNNIISPKRGRPEFLIGSKSLVYYDINSLRFRDFSDLLEVRSALPNVRVEWLIASPNAPEESIVVDAKYSGWRSGEALKVIGYFSAFGVNRGLVIFRGRIDPKISGGEVIEDGLIKVDLSSAQEAKHLWILRLVPHAEFESYNSRAISAFIETALGH